MKRVLDQIELFLICVTAFMIPIHIKLTSLTIFTLVIVALIKVENYNKFLKLLKSPKFYIFISPFILSITGLIHTDFMPEAKAQIEIVLSLLLFPFVFVSFSNNHIENRKEIFLSFFVVSVLFAYFVCMSVAVPTYIRSGDTNSLFYSSLSTIIKGPHHLSYTVIFAIILLAFSLAGKIDLFIRKNRQIKIIKYITLFLLIIFLLQLTSKITILFFVLFSIAFFVYLIRTKIINFRSGILTFISITALIILVLSLPAPRARFIVMYQAMIKDSDTDHQSHESTRLRFAAIDAGYNIGKENFWFGVGTGDLSTEMSNYYKENNIQGAYILNISPHNQFLRTFVMYGFVGLLSLVAIFVMMLIQAYKNKNGLFLSWTLLVIALFTVEDMFLIQDGVIYFAFFSSFFIFDNFSIKLKPLKDNNNE
ncbi:MAG: O-antigen ligase family protein [Bacteroidales bacterium]|nr:O-antigen ligase family protein [Bacteroidales bacterium]